MYNLKLVSIKEYCIKLVPLETGAMESLNWYYSKEYRSKLASVGAVVDDRANV